MSTTAADSVHAVAAALAPDLEVAIDLPTRLQWAGDASIYHLVPQMVVFPHSADQIVRVLAAARAHDLPVCTRAGGTSLSGQAVTDGILMVMSRHWRAIAVGADGETVTCGAGAVGAWVNARLAPHHRRIGPDPASIQAAEIGGIVANNASGMCCGVHENSYRTVTGLELVLADGTHFDTGADDVDERLRTMQPALCAGLETLRDEIRADAALSERIATAFQTKNTVGYSLNAFLDSDTPAAILQRLIVGSEGTLGVLCHATFRTVPMPAHRATALLPFASVEDASAAVAPLADSGAAAVEILDHLALQRVRDRLPTPMPAGEPAALLVEYQDEDPFALEERTIAARQLLDTLPLAAAADFTRDAELQARLWKVRKGLFPSVGAVRAKQTAVVIEDITFPVAQLASGVRALQELFQRYEYTDAVIFGHAKDGNLHFTLTPDFAAEGAVDRYRSFMAALARVVLAAGGHLKAEHGTGRNMAPFVEAQWGPDVVALMRRIKTLLDPDGILNPGVVLSDDPEAHIRHLKVLPSVDPIVDKCIECGFCEPVCPSRDATVSPRQRIALLRHAQRDADSAAAVRRIWQHAGLDTCAADGMCATACPVDINTGDLVKAERAAQRGALARGTADLIRRAFPLVAWGARMGLVAAEVVGLRRLPGRSVPLPRPAPRLSDDWPTAQLDAPTLLYVPSCLSRTMAGAGTPAPEALRQLCAAAGVGLVLPPGINGFCCGQPFASKGFPAADADLAARWQRMVQEADLPETGERIVVIDTSTCAAHLSHHVPDGWRLLHPAQVAAEILLPLLRAAQRLGPVPATLLHPTCSEQRQGWSTELTTAFDDQGTLPVAAGCCGMAGDRGWQQPELTAAATAREGAEAAEHTGAHACTNIACGLAIGAAAGKEYEHVWSVLAGALRE